MSLSHTTDVIVDLETLGTRPGFIIMEIAAVAFNINDPVDKALGTFSSKISITDSIKKGFLISPNTMEWWVRTNNERLLQYLDDDTPLNKTLIDFWGWMETYPVSRVWGNSARFDLGILDEYYHREGLDYPWSHLNEADLRTLAHFRPKIKKDEPFVGTRHNPVDDCKHQMKYLKKMAKSLNLLKP